MAIVKTFFAAMDGAYHAKFELLIYQLIQMLLGTDQQGQKFLNHQDNIRFQLVTDLEEKFPPYLYVSFPRNTGDAALFNIGAVSQHGGTYMKLEEPVPIKGFSLQHFATMIAMRLAQQLSWQGYALDTPEPKFCRESAGVGFNAQHTWIFDYVRKPEPGIIETSCIAAGDGDNYRSVLVGKPTITATGHTQTEAVNAILKLLKELGRPHTGKDYTFSY